MPISTMGAFETAVVLVSFTSNCGFLQRAVRLSNTHVFIVSYFERLANLDVHSTYRRPAVSGLQYKNVCKDFFSKTPYTILRCGIPVVFGYMEMNTNRQIYSIHFYISQ